MIRPGRMTRRWWLIFGLGAGVVGGLGAWARHDPWPVRLVIPPGNTPMQTWFAGDGRSFLVLAPNTASWDLATGREVGPTGLDPTIRWMANAPDGRSCLGYRATSHQELGGTPEVVWVDVATRAVKLRLPTTISSFLGLALAFGDEGRSIRALSLLKRDDSLWVETWDVATGKAGSGAMITPPRGWGFAGCSAALGLVAYHDEGAGGIRLWDCATDRPTGDLLQVPGRPFDPKADLLFAPDGRTLVVAHADGRADFWDVPARRPIRSAWLHHGELNPASWEFAPDGRTILSSVREPPAAPSRLDPVRDFVEDHVGAWFPEWYEEVHEAVVVDVATGRRLARYRGPTYLGWFSPDGRWIIGDQPDGKLAVRAAPRPPGD